MVNIWKYVVKFSPVVVAGVMAVMQALGDQQDAEKLEDLENRLSQLENKE